MAAIGRVYEKFIGDVLVKALVIDLAVAIPDGVAIHVDVVELVVQANLLKLLVHGVEGAEIPQPSLG